jgi:hypothetical protein
MTLVPFGLHLRQARRIMALPGLHADSPALFHVVGWPPCAAA